MEIIHGIPHPFRQWAIKLFLDALGEKIVPAMGKRSRAEELLDKCMNAEGCILAVDGNNLLGMAGLNSRETSFVDAGMADFIRFAGFFRSVWTLPILASMEHPTGADEYYIDMLAVSPNARGKGVGRTLIAEIEKKARSLKKKRVTLQVVDTNPRAKKLYEELGFGTIKTYNTYPWGLMVGWTFRKVDFMEKLL